MKNYQRLNDAATVVSYNLSLTTADKKKHVISMQADVGNAIKKT